MPRTPKHVIPIHPQAAAVAADADREVVIELYEKQPKIYPRAVHGWFAGWRWAMVWLTQLVFYGLPWLQWNGRQAVLFDPTQRRFQIFGLLLQPQDFIYLAALLVISALALFFFTAMAGRLWCGYACPQTVYTEIFLWVERRVEGDRLARIRLDAGAWTANKLARKGSKQALWILISLVTGFTFVGYFTPIRTLASEAVALSFSPWEWFWVLFYGFATYGNAGYLREQMCKYICPYARFQSALIDRDSMVIAYDSARGDPRGGRSRKADRDALNLGDCVDCKLCVHVCPTGIDIRNGLQNECIGCAACIDACDDVMDRMGYSKGLIRYSTENGVAQGLARSEMLRRVARPRVLIYGALLGAAVAALAVSLWQRPDFRVDIIRDRAALARVADDGSVENVYQLHLVNATERPLRLSVALASEGNLRDAISATGLHIVTPTSTTLEAAASGKLPLRLRLAADAAEPLRGRSTSIGLVITATGGDSSSAQTMTEKSTFFVPR